MPVSKISHSKIYYEQHNLIIKVKFINYNYTVHSPKSYAQMRMTLVHNLSINFMDEFKHKNCKELSSRIAYCVRRVNAALVMLDGK